jgi:hypothetical protein
MPESSTELPTVLASSVVRATHKGESHGGVYLVDMASGSVDQVLDWDDSSIDWEGRGGDRGLRGIGFHGDRVFLAASDEIFIFDRRFNRLGSIRNPYLRHCHEIFISGDRLFMTSTGFDSVLEYDLSARRFLRGYCFRLAAFWRRRIRRRLRINPRPRFSTFDPESGGGPPPADTCHINNVFFQDGALYISGRGLRNVWQVRGERRSPFARIPYGSHNARPFREGVILNHTDTDRIVHVSRKGRVRRSFPLVHYESEHLLHSDLTRDLARQAFGRGLAVVNDGLIVGGSSPATLTAYQFDPPRVLRSINVTMDVRNAVHGLEVWPYSS